MRRSLLLIAVILLTSCAREEVYGAGITLSEITPLAELVAGGEEKVGQEYLIEGIMTEVCQKKGCWMEVKDGENRIHVIFKDYGFFMPKDGAGRKATAQGIYTIESYEDQDENGNTVIVNYDNFIASGVILE